MNYLKPVVTLVLLIISSTALAAGGAADSEGSSFLLWIFLGFGALIIAFQTVPGLLLFYSMIKGVMSSAVKKESESSKH